MKRYPHSAIILLAVLAYVGCSKTEELQYNPDSALQIESVSGISPFALTAKAVITGNSLPGSDAATGIGIFVTASDGWAYDGHNKGYTNVNFANSGSGWSTATPVYLSDTQGKLYGYFPHSGTANDLRAVPVASSLNGTDYLYAESQTVSHSNKDVSLQMNHALSRLHLTIKKGANFTADAPLSKITLKSTAIDATGTMDLTTGAITATKKSGETGTVELATDGTITADGIEKDILLVPADNSEGKKDITIILTIGGKLASVSLSGENGIDIRSGIQNNITLTIEDTGIKVSGVGVGEWGEGGSQQVQVGAHTVTVKIADDVPAGDIMYATYVDGNNFIINATSLRDKKLACNVEGDAECEITVTNDIFTVIISEISSNIEAVLGYATTYALTVTSDSNGKVWIGDDETKTSGQFVPGEQVVIHAAPNDKFRLFKWDDNNRETSRTITIGETDATYSASFISADLIPGKFTVGSGKQVFFSKGNLYCSGVTFNEDGTVESMAAATWGFETNQYDTTPSSDGSRDPNHISHFMWCSTAEKAMALNYDSSWNGESPFFAEKNFTVNDYSGWSVLTGGEGGEWEYLLDKRVTTYGTNRRYATVKVNGIAGLLIFPDDFSSWPTSAGTEPEPFNTNSNNWNNRNYSLSEFEVLEATGCVFLPAAGFHNGSDGGADVNNVGYGGYYWSASPHLDNYAYDCHFDSGDVYLHHVYARNWPRSVRLVTEYQSEPSAE